MFPRLSGAAPGVGGLRSCLLAMGWTISRLTVNGRLFFVSLHFFVCVSDSSHHNTGLCRGITTGQQFRHLLRLLWRQIARRYARASFRLESLGVALYALRSAEPGCLGVWCGVGVCGGLHPWMLALNPAPAARLSTGGPSQHRRPVSAAHFWLFTRLSIAVS